MQQLNEMATIQGLGIGKVKQQNMVPMMKTEAERCTVLQHYTRKKSTPTNHSLTLSIARRNL